MASQSLDPYRSIRISRMMYHKLHHRMSWVSLQPFSAINVNVHKILSSYSSFKHAMLGFRVFWPQFHQTILITILPRPSRQAVFIYSILSLNIEPYSPMMTQYCQWKTRTAQCTATFFTAGLCRRYAMLKASAKMSLSLRCLSR